MLSSSCLLLRSMWNIHAGNSRLILSGGLRRASPEVRPTMSGRRERSDGSECRRDCGFSETQALGRDVLLAVDLERHAVARLDVLLVLQRALPQGIETGLLRRRERQRQQLGTRLQRLRAGEADEGI